MKLPIIFACVALTACGTPPANDTTTAANGVAVDPVTAEAVSDTKAAEADALKAADAELDNLSNRIDDAGNGVGKAGDRVSNTTKVEVY